MNQTTFSYGHKIAAEREVDHLLIGAACARRNGTVGETDARVLREALVDALARLEVANGTEEEIVDLKREIDCGIGEKKRLDGFSCLSSEDCAECRIFQTKQEKDCGLPADEPRGFKVCRYTIGTCALCEAADERHALDCGLGETLREHGDPCQLDDGRTCTACRLAEVERRLTEEQGARHKAEIEAERLRESNPEAASVEALRAEVDCGVEAHGLKGCQLLAFRIACRPEIPQKGCLRCELASAEQERDHHLETVEIERAAKVEAREERERLRLELVATRDALAQARALLAALPADPPSRAPRRRSPPVQEGPTLLERLMSSPEVEEPQIVTTEPPKATRKRASRKASAS
jgi:hypothetical protein